MIEFTTIRYETEFASATQIMVQAPSRGKAEYPFEISSAPDSLVVVPARINGTQLALPDGARYDLCLNGQPIASQSVNKPKRFIRHEGDSLLEAILISPDNGRWSAKIRTERSVDFCIHVLAAKRRRKARKKGKKKTTRAAKGTPSKSKFKCKACKATAKAIALAIAALVIASAIPQALKAAVSDFLGISLVAAETFIKSMIGFAAALIAEFMCEKVGICP